MTSQNERDLLNGDVDIIGLLLSVWRRKVTVLLAVLLFGVLGVVYMVLVPGKYAAEFVLRGPQGAELSSYAPLNDGIKEHYGDFVQNVGQGTQRSNQFEISTNSLELDMVQELQDYAEYEAALKEFVPSVRDMSDDEFKDAQAKLRAKFVITPATERDPEARVTFVWADEDQLLKVFATVLKRAEEQVNADKLKAFESLAKNIERRNEAESYKLESALHAAKEIIDLEKQRALLFLKEQAEIARELDLAENNLAEGGPDNQVSLRISPSQDSSQDDEPGLSTGYELPDAAYLRGYKSLEKEAALIASRTNEQNYILNPSYMTIKRALAELKNDTSADQFRAVIASSPLALGTDVFEISAASIEVEDKRSVPLILALSLILGAIAGICLVLLQDAMKRRKSRDAA